MNGVRSAKLGLFGEGCLVRRARRQRVPSPKRHWEHSAVDLLTVAQVRRWVAGLANMGIGPHAHPLARA